MDDYDEVVIAGDDPYWLSRCLYDLAIDVGIPPPHFYGKREYEDYNGAEKWQITTYIPGRNTDAHDLGMVYTIPYPDFEVSVGMAMQGAIARICNRYRAHITHGSVFRLFGERYDTGEAVDRRHQHLTPTRSHFMEREFMAVDMEVMIQRQIAVIDSQRERIKKLERTLLNLSDHKDELMGKVEDKEAMIFATQAQSAHFAMEFNQIDQVKSERNKLQKDVDELQEKLARVTVVQGEKEPMISPTPVVHEAPATEEEEEDPEEVEFVSSSDEDPDTEESSAGSDPPSKKRMRTTHYVKLFKTQA